MKFFIGSTFYSSFFLKSAPGTSSSLAVFVVFYFLNWQSICGKAMLLILLLFLHFICYPVFVSKYKTNDPSRYTLDEAIAMILLNIFFFTPGHWLAAFALFRFFDILKPLGIKKMEVLPGVADSLKNIIDDLLAAAYTFLVIIAYDLYF